MIFQRQPDGRVLVDRETLATSLGASVEAIRKRCAVVGYLGDPGVLDRRHRRRAVYDYEAAKAALADLDPRPAAPTGAPEVLLTAAEAERYLGISPGTVRSWVSRGRLDAAGRRAGRVIYRAHELLDLRAAGAV